MKYTTTKEIIFDSNNLPADISKVEWCTRQEHEDAIKELKVEIERLNKILLEGDFGVKDL